MIGRRALAALAAAPALAQGGQPADYRWKVTRNGSEIGSHTVVFRREGDTLLAQSDVLIAPRVLGVVVYRYEHRYTEVTRAGRMVSVRSRLNRNGSIVEVEAEAMAGGVAVRGPEGVLRLPPDAAPLSWWHPERFGGAAPLFGTTTGKLMDLRWTRAGLPAGGTRWHCEGEVDATMDYDAPGRWVTYAVVGDDGSTVRYSAA